MENKVGVVRGTDMIPSFRELLALTDFNKVLLQACESSERDKAHFKIAIKPNMMVFVNPRGHKAIVTDKDLVECLVDHILSLGFRDISVCEAQNDVGRMLQNHNVQFVAEQIGYDPRGRYRIADLTLESLPFQYVYTDERGRTRTWKDRVGRTWQEADFRITFAKCKTHEHDWMTLAVKNVYGCFPRADKVAKYHIRNEIFDVTGRAVRNFPLHFAFVDAWIGSDGFQGYKIAQPRELKMLFGGRDAIAVDMEVFRRAGLDRRKSRILKKTVEQVYDGRFPEYVVAGDQDTLFSQLGPWENIDDDIVNGIDLLEEVYISWAFINLRPSAEVVDYDLFPPRNIVYRFMVSLSKKLYGVFKLTKLWRRLYSGRG
jgi:uncharacterized protein (DUF362 family)